MFESLIVLNRISLIIIYTPVNSYMKLHFSISILELTKYLRLTRAESATLSLAQSLIPPSSPPNTPSNSEKSKTNTKLFSALPALQLNKVRM